MLGLASSGSERLLRGRPQPYHQAGMILPRSQKESETSMPENQPQFELRQIYVTDISFESPGAPEIFQKEWEPKISVDMSTESKELSAGAHEVSLMVTITASSKSKEVYIAEAKQAGIFLVKNFEKMQLDHFLNIYCPNILYPYIRETISTMVHKGGFAPLYLAPVNFEALYQQRNKENS